MSLPGLERLPVSVKVVCQHEGEGKYCTKCGSCTHPEVQPLTPHQCRARHKRFCADGVDFCPHCGQDISIYRMLQIH